VAYAVVFPYRRALAVRTPLCDLLGIDHPVMLAGMAGVAYADVCAAVSEAGGFGTLGMAGRSPKGIRAEMRRVKELTQKPFGVDLLAAVPASLTQSVDVIVEEGAKAFIAGLGVPEPILGRLKEAGIVVISMCGTVRHAVKAERAGVDVVVAQGTEAGGHTGLVGGMALVPQIVDAVKIPVVAAGSIFDGRGLAAALAFGAQGVWMGTRFIASKEANAARAYKDAILGATDESTIITRAYSGKPMRVIKNEYVAEMEAHPEQIKPFPEQGLISFQRNVMGGLSGKLEGVDPKRDALAAGQGAGAISDLPAAGDIVRRVVREAEEILATLGTRHGRAPTAR
jgi:enoyl-[acyl-carrier protein] reductase II